MRRIVALILLMLPAPLAAQHAPPGALSCTGCHAPDTQGPLSLDALSADEIITALADFHSGARETTIMNRITAGFSQAELALIAQWIARED